jgi:phosphotransferase system enzyme I (PtsI)
VSLRFHGLGVSPGVVIGTVYLLHTEQLPVVPDPIPPERVTEEIERFHRARDEARRELEDLKDRVLAALGDHYTGILEAQRLILDDTTLIDKTIQRIRVGRVSARWAVKEVVGEYDRRFAAMDESHLSDKGGDLSDVHLRLQRLLRGEWDQRSKMPDGPLIVVAHSLAPSDTVELSRRGVVGLATDVGGPTSHTAILAQALSVPAVAGLRDMCQQARPGDAIVLDGSSGEVVLMPSATESAEAIQRRQTWIASEEQAMARARDLPVRTQDGVEITVRANIEFAADADNAVRFGAQGVGLYRSEFLFLTHSPDLPTEEKHFETYVEIARKVAPHPAVVRTLDLGGEKYFHEILDRDEGNPVLGLRAVRFCLKRPDIFRPQLRGLLRAAVEKNLQIMLPLVTTIEEIRQVRKLLNEQADALKREGKEARANVPLGIMIEVPAAAVAADVLAREVDFLSLGTNDLIQYSLAVDRGNESVNYLYQPLHPGVLRMVRFVVDTARGQGIPLSICGEMAADPAATRLLVGLGLHELSMQPRAIAAVREMVASIDSREAATAAGEMLEAGGSRSMFEAGVIDHR